MTLHTPRWATALLGERAACTRVIGGGTSRTTLLLEVPPRPGGIVARHDEGAGPLADTPFSLGREASTYAAVAAADIPVPAVVAVADDELSFAVEEVAGTVDRAADALDDYLRILGVLHSTGVCHAPSGHAGFDADGTDDLTIWRRIAEDRIVRPAPLVAAALDALDRHGAADVPRPVLCHGDAGFGNYLHAGHAVTGLVDWEMSHTGDPHDDLASVAVRAMLSRIPLGDYRARIGWHWEPASGLRFDDHRYQLGVAATLTRMVISCLAALDHPGPGADRTTQLMGLPIMETHLVRALAGLAGEALEPSPVTSADPAFVAEIARLLREPLPADSGAGVVRRRAYLAAQLRTIDTGATIDLPVHTSGVASSLGELAADVAGRLGALPSSRSLADAPIPGVEPCPPTA